MNQKKDSLENKEQEGPRKKSKVTLDMINQMMIDKRKHRLSRRGIKDVNL